MGVYNYSQIKSIEVKNFRNIVDTCVNFDESPIVCLVGDNESGKTSFNLAVSVLAGHKNPKEQRSYIREGTNGFGVLLTLEDGHQITRIKSNNMNGYMIKQGEEVKYQTSKIGEGLPVQVSELMGIIEEPETGEFLQFRTYEDNVLFAYTTASTNYKMIYGALKVEQLTKAIAIGNNEANELKAEKNRLEIASGTVMGQIKSINIIDTSNLEKVSKRVRDMLSSSTKVKELVESRERIKIIEESIPSVDGISEITGMEQLQSLYRLSELLADSKVNIIDTDGIEEIDLMPRLDSLYRLKELLEESKKDVADVNGIEEIDVGLVSKLESISNLIQQRNKLLQLVEESEAVRKEQELLEKEQESLLEELKANGVKIISCPRCGEAIPFSESEVMG